MIAKVLLFCAAVAAANATALLNSGILASGLLNSALVAPGLYNTGIVAPGLLNSGMVAPGLLNSGLAFKSAAALLSAPLATPTDRRVIGAAGLLAGTPLVYNNGLPSTLGTGIVSPVGLGSAGILTGPAAVKPILK